MKSNHAVVLWEKENQFSQIKVKQICYDNDEVTDENLVVNKIWNIEYEKGKFQMATVIAIGSRAKMAQLAADKAEELANKSMQEKDDEYMMKQKVDRKEVARRKITADDYEFPKSSGSVKKQKVLLKTENQQRSSNDVIMQMQESQLILLAEANTSNADPVPNSSLAVQSESEIFGIDSNLRDFNEDIVENENVKTPQQIIERLKSQLKDANKEKRRLRKQLKNLEQNRVEISEPELVDLGNNIFFEKSVLREIKSDYRYHPSKFLRAIMYNTGIFTREEVASCSVTGQKCRDGQRPRLDPIRFKTLRDYTIKVCKLKPNTGPYVKFHRTIRDVCSDARKFLKTHT